MIWQLNFPGLRPQAKRNAQVGRFGAYREPQYTAWRQEFALLASRQLWLAQPIAYPVAISVTFATASGVMRPDLDNAFAACADGLMDAHILADDKWMRRITAQVVKVPRSQAGITVTIEEIA